MEHLVKVGHLKEFMVGQGGSTTGKTSGNRGNVLPPPLLIIEVIHAASISMRASCKKEVLSITPQQELEAGCRPEKRLRSNKELITFGHDDLEGIFQPHNYALVMAMRIGGFLIKMMLIDQGSRA